MQNKTSIILALGLMIIGTTGCGKLEVIPPVEPELRPYYSAYRNMMIKHGYKSVDIPQLSILFVDHIGDEDGMSTAGQCSITGFRATGLSRKVIISKPAYDRFNPNGDQYDAGVERLLFHEIAHCMHAIGHTDETTPKLINTGKGIGIDHFIEHNCSHLMDHATSGRSGSFDRLCYEQHHDMYMNQLKEIFNKGIYR